MTEQEAQAVTGRWLDEAGVAPGMRVLEVGCGPGAVTELLLAVDRAPALLALAAARSPDPRVSFVEADLETDLPDLGTFDAVIGRRVLMYLRDPAATLARLLERVRPGGLVFFQ